MGCFHLLTVVTNAIMKVGMQYSLYFIFQLQFMFHTVSSHSWWLCSLSTDLANPDPLFLGGGHQQHRKWCLNRVHLTRTFSMRHITASLQLGTLGSTSAQRSGAILTSKITNKNTET